MKLPPPHPCADTKEYKDYQLPIFERSAKNPIAWSSQSRSLVKAARLLRLENDAFFASVKAGKIDYDGTDLAPVFMMLMAFAIENLLKGILIMREPDLVTNVKLETWEGGGHDLVELAKDAQVTLTGDETSLLQTLSIYGQWAGRYPCPLKHEDRLPRPIEGDGYGPLTRIADTDPVLALCGRFEQILEEERTEKKNSPQG